MAAGKIGTYAISTISTSSWMNEPILQGPPRSRKARGVKEIAYPIFAECANVLEDAFWSEKLNAMAYGKFPAKFAYQNGALVFKKGVKVVASLTVDTNAYESAYVVVDFLRQHGGLTSPLDKQITVTLEHDRHRQSQPREQLTWGTAKKRMQECMLSHYLMAQKASMGLSDFEIEHLRQTIRLGISNKYFGNHNIRVEDNQIQMIEGLRWNPETRTFFQDPDLKQVITRTYVRNATKEENDWSSREAKDKDMRPYFSAHWAKYVAGLSKKMGRYCHRHPRVITLVSGQPVLVDDWSGTSTTGRKSRSRTSISTTDTDTDTTDILTTDDDEYYA